MTHKLVRRLVFLVAAAALVASIGFALVVSYTPRLSGAALPAGEPIRAFAPKVLPVPHPVDTPRFVNCDACHARGAPLASPANHRTFDNRSCGLCHAYPESGDGARVAVETAEHGFGWHSPFDEAAMRDFSLPDACVLLSTLEQIIIGEHCSLRPDGQACIACHWAERADAGVRLDNLTGKQDLIDRGYVADFVSPDSAKPPHLKRLFADWQARGYPD